ncbi:alpha-L-rhamnosidase [Actinocrispum wychmicini]|uniref:alpha-L-rhamnosidase n=1 Tax=Actinocrispum wychmicini TaxID=1213861 RepID=UPI001FB5C58D|nr:alpha-L-rhamnosidase [Actinocrispum wychmicini]
MTTGMMALPPGPADAAGGGALSVGRTTVEYADAPLGTDALNPRLSWVLGASENGQHQTAYQVRVNGVWDSGKVTSDRSVAVPYAGPPLRPRTRYSWQVRVWDAQDQPSDWSAVRWWETGFLGGAWQARWIGAPAATAPPTVDGASWIWSLDGTVDSAPVGPRWFRAAVDVPGQVTSAKIVATADDDFTLYVGGQQVLFAPEATDSWRTGLVADVTHLVSGRVVVAAVATNRGTAHPGNPAGLLVRLVVNGQTTLVTGDGWRVTATEQTGWQQPGFDDSRWDRAAVLAPYGGGLWGANVSVPTPEAPAPLLRKDFTLTRPVVTARLYISGLAYYDVVVNGTRVGSQVLDPGFTDYDKTVLYATHDLSRLLKPGGNRIDVTLGRGFYGLTTPNVWNWQNASWHGEPRLLAQVEVDHTDRSHTTVATGPDWLLADSPTVTNSIYAGETYDARVTPTWRPAQVVDPPQGTLRGQQHEPIEVVEDVTPAVTELSPGVWVADMGRTMAGWSKVTVRAPAGTVIRLQHGEKLKADGSVQWEGSHVSGRYQTDEYICAGTGAETWEPRFSYKGFRYVQVTGARPEALVGRVVHTNVPQTGTFRCSEPFYEQLDRAMRRTILNNLHGIPTDTPMYEKNGWTGDAQLGLPTMMFAYGVPRFVTKWLNDIRDCQTSAGQLPVIVPSGGWGYNELGPSPEWTTVYPFALREMYRIYGDDKLAAEHWDTVVRYLDWEIARLRDGLALTELGDYLSPGTGGNPPEDTRLTATAYLHRALTAIAELGDVLGHNEVSARYRAVADRCRDRLNVAFLKDGHYQTAKDPGYRQTSNAVPLAFGLVPPGSVASVVDSLLADISARGNHLNTGCLGTSVLLPVLTANGHADVAHAIATQRTFPSWGFWFDNGADTMWEMWPTDSRSRDHYFEGTVVQWLYENVAGLRPGDAGYQRFTVRPDARVGVSWAQAAISTVRGAASVAWNMVGSTMHLTVGVPVGCAAEVFVPGSSVTAPPGVRFVRAEAGFQVHLAPAGQWTFTGDLDHP